MGTYDLRSYGGEHRGSQAEEKLLHDPGPFGVKWPLSVLPLENYAPFGTGMELKDGLTEGRNYVRV